MRRSSAPSQLASKNKRTFMPPLLMSTVAGPGSGLSKPNLKQQQQAEKHKLDETQEMRPGANQTGDHDLQISTPDVKKIKLGPSSNTENTAAGFHHQQKPKPARSSFISPLMKPQLEMKTQLKPASAQSEPDPQPKVQSIENTELPSKYYSVMWCKLSRKKHKKWEGDAVLIARGRSVILQDLEGKEIGKSSGFKPTELSTLKGGETLVIGGKEIEVMGDISADAFHSGKCFQSSCSTKNIQPSVVKQQAVSKPFMKPNKVGQELQPTENVKSTVCKHRHDPTAPGALVMPRPNKTHQRENDKLNQSIIDVVVDPYLCAHLRPHQREGVMFLYECMMGMRDFPGKGAILADDMGLGKTLQCITLTWTLLKQGPYGGRPTIKRVLVIAPGSLVKNWRREFRKWLGTERISVFAVAQDNRVEEYMKTAIYPVLVISYEMFVRSYEIIKNVRFDLVVCDEGHRLKNSSIKTTSLISSLATSRRVVLTGTPVQNDLQEFYSIVEFCNPGLLGSSSAFHRLYEAPVVAARQPGATPEEVILGENRASELARLTSLFVLRRNSDINNQYLPPKVESVIFCKPSPVQLYLYKQLIVSRLFRSCVSMSTDPGAHLVCISSLKKLCNHPKLIYDKTDSSEDSQVMDGLTFPDEFDADVLGLEYSGKLAALDQLLTSLQETSPNESIVLVSNYTQTLDVLQQLCKERNHSFLRLDGQTPTAKRQQLVEHFNSSYSDTFVFLLSSKAGGVGLNLIGASRLVLFDIDWNPANDLQAMARVWRDGQKKTVHIYRFLTTGTIEESIYQRQISKQGLSGAVVDCRISSANVQFSKEDLKDLFTLRESTSCYTHELLACTCDKTKPTSSDDDSGLSRACQQSSIHSKSKNIAMDELMSWHHVEVPENILHFQDEHLVKAKDSISYIFWHECNKQQKSETSETGSK
ncbi:DNA repair and recombination protein RAD54B-like [Tubulanus polymorphus]|uniref:DNA repair and recombination protein RAD54B-like n=1 Tax=Tubulanus polymorphus TaxID=672921 RepID=UPI003DA26E11